MEEDDSSSYGPPPDPSLRSWRHPSELAAERAASQADATSGSSNVIPIHATQPTEPASTRRRARTLTVGAAAAVAVCIGGLSLQTSSVNEDTTALVTSGGDETVDEDSVNPIRIVIDPATAAVGAQVDDIPPDDDYLLVEQPGEDEPLIAGQIDVSEPPTTTGAESHTTLTLALDDVNATVSVEGVLALYHGPEHLPLASGLIVDDLILASASSLSDIETVFIPVEAAGGTSDGSQSNVEWLEFTVVASDLYSDIAVLAPNSPVDLTPVVTTPGGPVANAGQTVAIVGGHSLEIRVEETLGEDDNSVIDNPASNDSTGGEAPIIRTSDQSRLASLGELAGTDQRTTSRSGYEILGALLTTCRNSDLLAGSALVDENGFTLGIIVDSSGPLASAIPLEIAIAIGRSLSANEWSGGAWLGVTGQSVDEGIKIHSIEAEGPADAAGLQVGDLITRVNDNPLTDLAELLHTLRTFASGDLVTIQIERPDSETGLIDVLTLDVQLAKKQQP